MKRLPLFNFLQPIPQKSLEVLRMQTLTILGLEDLRHASLSTPPIPPRNGEIVYSIHTARETFVQSIRRMNSPVENSYT